MWLKKKECDVFGHILFRKCVLIIYVMNQTAHVDLFIANNVMYIINSESLEMFETKQYVNDENRFFIKISTKDVPRNNQTYY